MGSYSSQTVFGLNTNLVLVGSYSKQASCMYKERLLEKAHPLVWEQLQQVNRWIYCEGKQGPLRKGVLFLESLRSKVSLQFAQIFLVSPRSLNTLCLELRRRLQHETWRRYRPRARAGVTCATVQSRGS